MTRSLLTTSIISSLHDGISLAGHLIKWRDFGCQLTLFFKSWNCWNSLYCLKPLSTKTWLLASGWSLQSPKCTLSKLTKDCEDINYISNIMWDNCMECGHWTNNFTMQHHRPSQNRLAAGSMSSMKFVVRLHICTFKALICRVVLETRNN